jgi:hypothetical protein
MKKTSIFLIITLLVSGAALLLNNLGVISIGLNLIWPLFPLTYGAYLFFQFRKNRNSDTLGSAVFFALIGAFFFATNFFAWPDALPWWPVFPLFWGLGILTTWLSGGRSNTRLIVQSVILLGISCLLLFGSQSWAKDYFKFWPIILVFAGIIMFIRNRKSPISND